MSKKPTFEELTATAREKMSRRPVSPPEPPKVEVTEELVNMFLVELTNLSIRTGVAISGCGCCGSPFLVGLPKDLPEHALKYTSEKSEHVRPTVYGKEFY
jgi:hypothetical protein